MDIIKAFIARNYAAVILVSVAALSIVGAAWYIVSNNVPAFNAITATRGNIIASLDEPAMIVAENNVGLSFQEPGQISHVYVQDGDTVRPGAILADLNHAALEAALEQATAALQSAQARLDELQAGTRPEELSIDQTAVTNAQANLSVAVGSAYTSADDAIHNQIDNLFSNPQTSYPIFLVQVNDFQLQNNIQGTRVVIETTLKNWHDALATAGSSQFSLANTADADLQQVKLFLDTIALAVNDATPSLTMTSTVLAGYKANIVTARTEVIAAMSNLTNTEASLQTAQNNLTLARAGSTAQDIKAQQAVVAQGKAAVDAAQVALNNAYLVAPFAGTVENLTAQVGQVVPPGAPVLTLVNSSGLKIETHVSEADIAKVTTDNNANITLDAFGTERILPAKVTAIARVETQVNGAPAYLVTLHFTDPQNNVRDGMTGNVSIILAQHDNVLAVPSRLVIKNGSDYFVLVQAADGNEQQPVKIGLIGNNGMTEIISGISEGEALANY